MWLKERYRSVFISDVHLGSRGSRANDLKGFLDSLYTQKLFIIGDFIDMWLMKRKWYFPIAHMNILRKVMKLAKKGTEVYYIVGNHDDMFRTLAEEDNFILNFGSINIVNEMTYYTLEHKKILLIHGDKFDFITINQKWLSVLGTYLYEQIIKLNSVMNKCMKIFGFKYWSLSKFVKKNIKKAVMYFDGFEKALIEYAKQGKYDGVFAGHIHHATLKKTDSGLLYGNTGDWIESCTAIVETPGGDFQL
jgi:UDP-2,3-diacylglucosamine pyrophosphatase LpxH